ncbi:hypothetical protein BKA57DRAFT_444132 [Linnemannia elongata]|nr:hypothetical protein BKA57DRAFT_444132 [Linnemannia elongata]
MIWLKPVSVSLLLSPPFFFLIVLVILFLRTNDTLWFARFSVFIILFVQIEVVNLL